MSKVTLSSQIKHLDRQLSKELESLKYEITYKEYLGYELAYKRFKAKFERILSKKNETI